MKTHRILFIATLLLLAAYASSNSIPHAKAADGHMWLEAIPKTYQTSTYQPFSIAIVARNVLQADRLTALQFELKYDPAYFKITNIVEGPFLKKWAPHGTFTSYDVTESLGRAVYGTIILPNDVGTWDQTTWPNGDGEVATVNCEPIFLAHAPNTQPQTTITLQPMFGHMFLDADGNWIPYQTPTSCNYVYTFNYNPLPSYGEIVFNAPAFPSLTTTYTWDFGDGTQLITNSTSVRHHYNQLGTYTATLSTRIYEQDVVVPMTRIVEVGYWPTQLKVNVDGGSLYFRTETANFYVLITDYTQNVDVTQITAKLYREGNNVADLTNNIIHISKGLYEITYNIPATAQQGTYELIVETQWNYLTESGFKSFQISPTLTGFITNVDNGIATVSNGVNEVKVNLAAVNATVTGITTNSKGEILAKIDTSIGPLTTSLNAINATITRIDSNTAIMSTTLGDVKIKLVETQSTTMTATYITTILPIVAIILVAAILIYARKR